MKAASTKSCKAPLAWVLTLFALVVVTGLCFQPGTTDTDMQVLIRASGINPISRIPRERLTPVAHPARAIVYLCTPEADDLAGMEFSLRDDDFRRRIGLADQ